MVKYSVGTSAPLRASSPFGSRVHPLGRFPASSLPSAQPTVFSILVVSPGTGTTVYPSSPPGRPDCSAVTSTEAEMLSSSLLVVERVTAPDVNSGVRVKASAFTVTATVYGFSILPSSSAEAVRVKVRPEEVAIKLLSFTDTPAGSERVTNSAPSWPQVMPYRSLLSGPVRVNTPSGRESPSGHSSVKI